MLKTWSYKFYEAPNHGLILESLGPVCLYYFAPCRLLENNREDDSKWGLCLLASEKLSGEQREQEGGLGVIFLVLSLWLSLASSQDKRSLLFSRSPVPWTLPHFRFWQSLPTCLLTRGPGSLTASSLGPLRYPLWLPWSLPTLCN